MSTDRDKELDAAVKATLGGEPTPKLEEPEHLAIGDGTACFLDVNRMCSSECRAYDYSKEDKDSPEVCTVLASMKNFGVSLEKLVGVGTLLKKMGQDQTRVAPGQKPPNPGGRTPT